MVCNDSSYFIVPCHSETNWSNLYDIELGSLRTLHFHVRYGAEVLSQPRNRSLGNKQRSIRLECSHWTRGHVLNSKVLNASNGHTNSAVT